MCPRCRQHALGISPRRPCLDKSWTLARLGDPVDLVLVPASWISISLTVILTLSFVFGVTARLGSSLTLFIELSLLCTGAASLCCSSRGHATGKARRALQTFDRVRPAQIALLLAVVVFRPSLIGVVVQIERLAKPYRRHLPPYVYAAIQSIRRTAIGRAMISMVALGEGGLAAVALRKAWAHIGESEYLRRRFLGPTVAVSAAAAVASGVVAEEVKGYDVM